MLNEQEIVLKQKDLEGQENKVTHDLSTGDSNVTTPIAIPPLLYSKMAAGTVKAYR